MLFDYGASRPSGMGSNPALLTLPEKLLFQVLVATEGALLQKDAHNMAKSSLS